MGKNVTDRTETVRDTVRKEEVAVDKSSATGTTNAQPKPATAGTPSKP